MGYSLYMLVIHSSSLYSTFLKFFFQTQLIYSVLNFDFHYNHIFFFESSNVFLSLYENIIVFVNKITFFWSTWMSPPRIFIDLWIYSSPNRSIFYGSSLWRLNTGVFFLFFFFVRFIFPIVFRFPKLLEFLRKRGEWMTLLLPFLWLEWRSESTIFSNSICIFVYEWKSFSFTWSFWIQPSAVISIESWWRCSFPSAAFFWYSWYVVSILVISLSLSPFLFFFFNGLCPSSFLWKSLSGEKKLFKCWNVMFTLRGFWIRCSQLFP